MEETKKTKLTDLTDEELTEKLSEDKIKKLAEKNQFPAGLLCVACGNVLRGIREIRLGFHLQDKCYEKITK